MEKDRVIITRKTALQRNGPHLIYGIINLILGLAALGVCLPFFLMNPDVWPWLIGVFAGPILIILSAVLIFQILSYGNKCEKAKSEIEIEFVEDHLIVRSFANGEQVLERKIFYGQIGFYRVTKDYVFAFLGRNEALSLNRSDKLIAFLEGKGVRRR